VKKNNYEKQKTMMQTGDRSKEKKRGTNNKAAIAGGKRKRPDPRRAGKVIGGKPVARQKSLDRKSRLKAKQQIRRGTLRSKLDQSFVGSEKERRLTPEYGGAVEGRGQGGLGGENRLLLKNLVARRGEVNKKKDLICKKLEIVHLTGKRRGIGGKKNETKGGVRHGNGGTGNRKKKGTWKWETLEKIFF